ncbi:MAG: prepilin-type N-terminal cleavage/methylation domain-containing protein, partial [Acidimicrobiales bacterium]|nr:prepilin-type N-terminal cleavage/methylation domain-containing protein [Acidimicrobiales bacterium]
MTCLRRAYSDSDIGSLHCHAPRKRSDDDGFTLIELMVAITITLSLLALVPTVMQAVTHGADYAQGTSAGAAQALTLVQELESRVESASQICLPTQMTTVGPTVTAGFGVRVLTSAYGKSLWDQWIVDTATHTLQVQQWPTTWVVGNAVPPWVTIGNSIVNSSTVPFALPTVVTGSPQTLTVDLQMKETEGNESQNIEFKSSVTAFDTPYSSSP